MDVKKGHSERTHPLLLETKIPWHSIIRDKIIYLEAVLSGSQIIHVSTFASEFSAQLQMWKKNQPCMILIDLYLRNYLKG